MKRKKMMISLSIIASLVVVVLLGTGCAGMLNADSQEESPYSDIVAQFAERFDLDEDEVFDFIEELKDEHAAEMEANFEERLDELVEDGEITDDQKAAILEKKEEMQQFRQDMEDMTVADAREAVKDIKQEMQDWADENDLDLKGLFPEAAEKAGQRGGHLGFGFHW